MSTAVAKKKNAELSTDVMDDIFEFAGDGTVFDSSELQIPFIRVLQAMSPQLNKKKAEYIEGAASGDLFNTVSNQYWDGETGIMIVPCFQTTKYLEFVPREQGGGFRGEISVNDPILQRTTRSGAKEILPTGNELVKSDQHFCLVVDEDGITEPVVVDMKSTQLKVSRQWKSKIATNKIVHPATGKPFVPPVYATMWRLVTVEETNDQGSWANYKIEKVGLVENRDLLLEAKSFRESIMAGEVKAAAEEQSAPGSSDTDDIPF